MPTENRKTDLRAIVTESLIGMIATVTAAGKRTTAVFHTRPD